ncbi:hypothetical protein EV191_101240 [Tamaricihabitans halophyticus]|uniref:Secreted protein n=1 Tax=Tamaricihabitans halophyticus TaxID=1262583 RepID=A0A4R2R3K8_9PSEU|nr:hypothetical protein [Tamaricihabitans halophyticus]TCP56299.1 hypothetical protein EV191_101240 [Tamaricihabitans halophyticus]
MLKKAGFVVATAAASLLIVGGTASAASAEEPATPRADNEITFADAYYGFMESGGALGYGAAGLVANAYTGIALTPSLVAGSLS